MKTPSTHRPSSAMVVAMIALFVAIGGTAVALPGQNSVNSGDVKNETLKSQDLKDEQAVASSDVINNTLQSEDIGADEVTQSEIAFDAVTGLEILNGQVQSADLGNGVVSSSKIGTLAVGSGDLATISVVVDPTPHDFADQDEGNNDYEYGTSIVDCPAGTTVIGSGGDFVGAGNGGTGGDELQAITESRLASNGVIATAVSDVDNQDFAAIAYCLEAGA